MSKEIEDLLARISRAWLENHLEDLEGVFNPDIVMVLPGFSGHLKGADVMIAGFEDFCTHAKVYEYSESDLGIDVVGNTAAASFSFAMVYEREGRRCNDCGI